MIRRSLQVLSRLSLLMVFTLIVACVIGQWGAQWIGWAWTTSSTNTWRTWDVANGTSGIYVHWQRYDFQQPGQALACARRERGFLGVSCRFTEPATNPFVAGRMAYGRGSALSPFFVRLGFGCGHGLVFPQPYYGGFKRQDHFVHAPYLALMVAFLGAALPSIRAFLPSRRHTRRVATGHCASCGYDLRATPDRCPECGRAGPLRTKAATMADLLAATAILTKRRAKDARIEKRR